MTLHGTHTLGRRKTTAAGRQQRRTEHKPLSVGSVTGAKACYSESEGALELEVSRLDRYEVISVRLP